MPLVYNSTLKLKKTGNIRCLIMKGFLLFILMFQYGCSNENRDGDTGGNEIRRIVSLSPSITRQIIDLGCAHMIAGVTSHQPEVGNAEVVGAYIHPNFEKILILKPDAVLCSDEDGAVQRTAPLPGIRLIRFGRNSNFESLCDNYLKLAVILNKKDVAEIKLREYSTMLALSRRKFAKAPVMACFVSVKPLVTAGGLSFIGSIILDSGGRNAYHDAGAPFPIIALESLVARNPDIIISLDAENQEYFRKILGGFTLKAVKNGSVHFIGPDNISYFTPSDYVKSVGIITRIIEKNRSHEKI